MSDYQPYDDPSATETHEYHGEDPILSEIGIGNDLGALFETGGHEHGGYEHGEYPVHDSGSHDTGHDYDPSNGHEPGGVVGPTHVDYSSDPYAADTGDGHAQAGYGDGHAQAGYDDTHPGAQTSGDEYQPDSGYQPGTGGHDGGHSGTDSLSSR